MKLLVLVCLGSLVSIAPTHAQPTRPQPGGGGSTPREHEVHSATSKDGLTWTRDEGIRLKSASVPCVINDGDKRILLYVVRPPDEPGGVGGVSCAVSTDGTNFKIDPAFRIEGLSTRTAADPSVVKDTDGKFRLYYLASNHRGDPAAGENPHKINYALSDDGIRFRETGTAFEYDNLVDPDVFEFKRQWFMYVFGKGGTLIATSSDGKQFSYNRVMSPAGWGTVAPLTLADGRLRLYAFDQRTPIANTVRSFLSTDGLNWTAESGDRLKANDDEQITDPFVIPWRGGYKMYFKHSPAQTRNAAAGGPQNFGGQNNQRPDSQTGGRNFPPLPAGEGRGEGERRPQNQQAPNNFNPQPPPQNFNHADGPWNRDVIAWRVSPSGEVTKAATFERAGVPTIARLKDGRLIVAHQHFPENDRENFDKVAVHFSSDDGQTWGAAQVIQVANLPEGMRFPFDPTLVPLPDGRVRLYFTGNMGRTFGPSTPAIHSAISKDGVNYTYEPGVRFKVEGRMIIDCAVALHQGGFHLFVPDNGVGLSAGQRPGNEPVADRPREGVGYHATSTDGLNFTRLDDVQIGGRRRWLGNAESDGKLITFYGTGEGLSNGANAGGRPRGGFWMATSADGNSWKLIENPPISGGDPGAVKTRDGGMLVVITGESRLGSRGVPPNRPPQRPADGNPTDRDDGDRRNDFRPKSTAAMLSEMWSRGQATGDGPVKLKNFPLRLDDIGYIIPLGNLQSGHTTPSDHLYFVPKGATNHARANTRGPGPRADDRDFSQLYDVVAVADGYVVALQWRPNPQGGQAKYDPTVFDRAVDLKVFIEHSAKVWSYVDHLVEVDAAIMKQVPGGLQPGPPAHVRIPVKAGEVIGKIGNQTFDFALIDTATTRKGFVKPEQFLKRDPWKPHTVDPFDYIAEPLRGQLLAKNARKLPPFGGRIDYDIDGKLVGNWFEVGTGGYAGLNRRIDYWVGHLSIVYHHLDPKIIVISIGNYDGRAAQFWVKNNRPDPTTIGEADGVAKYELIHGQLSSNGQLQRRQDNDEVEGTALAQVLPGQKLKFEVFPGKIGDEIKGFTGEARTYER